VVPFFFKCGSKEIPDNVVDNDFNKNGDTQIPILDKTSPLIEPLGLLQGEWRLISKFNEINERINFKTKVSIEIKGYFLKKKSDNDLEFEDSIEVLLQNTQKSTMVFPKHENFELHYRKDSADQLVMSYYRFDKGYEVYKRVGLLERPNSNSSK
jgi:hypothetical protein